MINVKIVLIIFPYLFTKGHEKYTREKNKEPYSDSFILRYIIPAKIKVNGQQMLIIANTS